MIRRRNREETLIQAAIVERWKLLGYPGSLIAAIPNANAHGQPGLTPGLFDLMCIRRAGFVGFLELKKKGGVVSKAQREHQQILKAAGVPNHVAFGLDEAVWILEMWGIIRRPGT
jgi:hypothetical protein